MNIEISVSNRQRRVPLGSLASYRAFAAKALSLVLNPQICPKGSGVCTLLNASESLQCIDFVFVSDRKSAEVHSAFMQIEGPTDVITFDHGEIVIGAEVAIRQALDCGEGLEREVRRYMVHGLLHLHGYEDDTPDAAALMWAKQEAILSKAEGELLQDARALGA